MTNTVCGWELRKADYLKIHGDNSAAYATLIPQVNLSTGQTIADLMCGYAAVTKQLMLAAVAQKSQPRFVLVDGFDAQLKRSVEYLKDVSDKFEVERREENILSLKLAYESIDTAVLKFGLHELKDEQQIDALRQIYHVVKQKGVLFVWSNGGKTAYSNRFFNDVVRAKDLLAGFAHMAAHRHFPYIAELTGKIRSVGFELESNPVYVGPFNFVTRNLLESDFGGNEERLSVWNEYIRESITAQLKDEIQFEDDGDSISMTFDQRILKATKL